MNKLIPIAIFSILLITACVDTATQNRIRPVSGDSFLGRLHIDARIEQICVFNTSLAIIFLALIGVSLYFEAGDLLLLQIVGMIFMIAAVHLFCNNEIITFVVMALVVLKPYLLGN